MFFFFKQKTAYEMSIGDWSSDVCSSDLMIRRPPRSTRRLTPFPTRRSSDLDAVNSIDRYEVMLWFRSRGDECLSCEGSSGMPWMTSLPLIVRVHK